jgi:hypothetical protein
VRLRLKPPGNRRRHLLKPLPQTSLARTLASAPLPCIETTIRVFLAYLANLKKLTLLLHMLEEEIFDSFGRQAFAWRFLSHAPRRGFFPLATAFEPPAELNGFYHETEFTGILGAGHRPYLLS